MEYTTIQEVYDIFENELFKPYEIIDTFEHEGEGQITQTIKYNCREDQLIWCPDLRERYLCVGDRFATYNGNESLFLDWTNDPMKNYAFDSLLHLLKRNDKVRSEGYEGITTLKEEYRNYMRILFGKKKKPPSKNTGIKFFSCCPKNRIPINEGEVEKMKNYLIKNINNKYFFKFAWCMESGKHEDKPNLHFHLLGHYNNNGSKNFRGRVLINNWNKLYPDNPLEWTRGEHHGIDRKDCNTDIMIKDKLLYFHNESKGSHENFIDLNIYKEAGDWSKYRQG